MTDICRIVLADDHNLVRQGVKRIIEEHPHYQVLGEARDGLEVMELLQQAQPDLLILDLRMPRQDGLETARKVKELYPGVKILILTMYNVVAYLDEAISIDVEGFVLKEEADKVLISAIETICRGGKFFSHMER